MDVKSYLTFLWNFYTQISVNPFTRLEIEGNNIPTRVIISGKKFFLISIYNLGFNVGSVCYISKKLAKKNSNILEKVLKSDYIDQCLLTISLSKKDCKIYLYDIFGKKILTEKIKFTSINLF